MSSIVVNPRNQKELQFLSELLAKLNINAQIVSKEEMEDLGLSLLMKDVDRNDIVSEEEIGYKLRKR